MIIWQVRVVNILKTLMVPFPPKKIERIHPTLARTPYYGNTGCGVFERGVQN